jgi:hypothetical protein
VARNSQSKTTKEQEMETMKKARFTIILVCFFGLVSTALAQSPEEQADALRKAQDPLAHVKICRK